ncbi:PilZ domain-containing protein [Pseudomaricurvus alkylphenolicus]|uniref:PilZ domain-containing protein n=1 Tax=Pseudomaricurvus alkylphenolicus TaxID=1306991 RepID=UPI00142310FB|nr:PilZ domain-containing protein [Pseudomaricurvus alkylphenolicus]NIB39992.1 PilZ domain-containing protein [Pseudomaricurvus alkylphenolicus]
MNPGITDKPESSDQQQHNQKSAGLGGERIGVRTPFRCRISILHEAIGKVETTTRDISDGGVYLLFNRNPAPSVGEVLQAQVLDLPGGDGPLLQLQVVRSDPEGLGLKFI